MDFYKRGKHRGKGTRPFMPVHGRKPPRRPAEDRVMTVGDDAMIDDANPVRPETKTCAGAGPGGEGAGLEAMIGELKAERDNYLDLARRERADFDNYRKRVEREMKEIKKQSLASFLKDFFGPLDDMDRVLQESEKSHSFDALATGVRIMEENFWRVLAKAGVRRIDAKGKPFDPVLHEAMAAVPSADAPVNTVLEVYESGYKLDDHILRPARVIVSKAPDPEV